MFCDPRSFSPSRRHGGGAIADQISRSIERLRARKRIDCFLAYFQPATNTHAHPDRLRAIYEEAIGQPGIVGLIVGTRPDCVPEEVLDLLAEFSCRTWVSVEYGMQSSHDRSLRWMNRGHDYGVFRDAVERSLRRGLDVGGHVILGIPGESADDMRATAREVGRLGLRSVKLHNLYAVRDTRLAEQVESGSVRLPTLEEYVGYVVDFLELLPPWCVIDRLSGDAPNEYLLGPDLVPRQEPGPQVGRGGAGWPRFVAGKALPIAGLLRAFGGRVGQGMCGGSDRSFRRAMRVPWLAASLSASAALLRMASRMGPP